MNKIIFVFLICLVFQFACEKVETSSENQIVNNHKTNNSSQNMINSNVTNQVYINSNENNKNEVSEYLGCWGGTGGGILKISLGKIQNMLGSKNYSYKVIETKKGEKGSEYLLQFTDTPKGTYIKRFFLIKMQSSNHFLYFGYDSYENYQNNSFAGAGEFFKQNCNQ